MKLPRRPLQWVLALVALALMIRQDAVWIVMVILVGAVLAMMLNRTHGAVVETFADSMVPTMTDDLKETHRWVLWIDQVTKRAFPVLPTDSKAEAASMLGRISAGIERLIQFLVQRFPTHIGVKRLADRWDYHQLAEGKFDIEGVTSYTVNKGERIVLCMRNREGQLHHMNLVMFVLLHELAHIMSVSKSITRHNEEFQQNLAFLVEHAKSIGVYESNVDGKSENYCGMPDVRIP